MLGYDKRGLNNAIVLDLPFREGVGLITHDLAKPNHLAALTGHAPTWNDVHLIGPSDLGVLQFDGATQYLEIPGADTVDLDFTGDFSLAAWIYPIYTVSPMVIMCRNTTDARGWIMFLFDNPGLGPLLSFRTNQAGSHSECYAAGFTASEWHLVGFNRVSATTTATCFRNGRPVTTVGGTIILDPVACGAANKLLVGVQEGEVSDFYAGYMWRPRAWPRVLSESDWLSLFQHERRWFGV